MLLSPLGVGTLRASQLTALSFIYFYFQPERLTDLLTPIERHYLESAETRTNYALRLFPASDPCAQQFKALASRSGNPSALASRSAILQLISSAVGIETLFPVEEQTKSVGAKERFQQVIGRMTEADLVNCTLESLATQCRCSARHLNRLFQAFFKLSLSSRQKEVRMQKAARMLRETNLKIAEIAGDCGYRHMSLFNATFKARWKHTPTEWRHLQRQTTDCQPLG